MPRRSALVGISGALIAAQFPASSRSHSQASLLDYLPAEQHARLMRGNSDFDCAPAIGRALQETSCAQVALVVPAGVYNLVPAQVLHHADPNFECLAAIKICTNMRIVGQPGATFRMAPGFSNDQKPKAMVMFGTDGVHEDVELDGLTLDMNGRHNPISPERAGRIFNRFPQAQIFVSSGRNRPAARIDRVRITDTVFRNANGVSCIVMGQTEDGTSPLGRDWYLERCQFWENGHDTDDHSSVFAYAERVITRSCLFANRRPFDGTGVNTAYEVHGAKQEISGCAFANMLRGIWVAGNYSAPTTGTLIAENDFRTTFYGVDFFRDRAELAPIEDTRIMNNRFKFNDYLIANIPDLRFKAAVQVASEYSQKGVIISQNAVSKEGHAVTSAFLVVTGGFKGRRRHEDIVARANKGEGLTFGSFVRTVPTAGIGTLSITRNHWSNLAPSKTMQIAAGDAFESTIEPQPVGSLTIGGGSVSRSLAAGTRTYDVFINTTIEHLRLLRTTRRGGVEPKLIIGDAGRILVRSGDAA